MPPPTPISERPLPRRRPLNPTPPAPSQPQSQTQTTERPTKMPTRSQSNLVGRAPYDANKPDNKAVDDVIEQVQDTGSLERAARKLALYASLNGGQEAPGASASKEGGGKQEVIKPGQPGYYDPEEEAIAQAEAEKRVGDDDECAVDDDDEDDEGVDVMGDGDQRDVDEVVHLQEIVEGLWVGDLVAAMDSDGLDERGITNIVSLLRPRLTFPSHFSVLPVEIDDSPDTDILTHLPTCVSWIGEALVKRELSLSTAETPPLEMERDVLVRQTPTTKAGGVLVHCQAGMSRSATIAAAYLITALSLDPSDAIEMVRDHRPVIDPSATFRHQLDLFYTGDGKVTLRDRSTRHFYMERNASFFMNGQTSSPAVDKMAKYPATPTPSQPATPSGGLGRRKIRCKVCRRFLAVREHMMDHILDQAPISRPRTPSNFSLPAPAHRLSMSMSTELGASGSNTPMERRGSGTNSPIERRGSTVSDVINPLTGLPGARSRQPSMSASDHPGHISPLSPLSPMNDPMGGSVGGGSVPFPRASTPGLFLTALTPVDPAAAVVESPKSDPVDSRRAQSSPAAAITPPSASPTPSPPATMASRRSISSSRPLMSAEQLASRLPPHLQALRSGSSGPAAIVSSPISSSPPSSPERETSGSAANQGSGSGSGSGSGTSADSTRTAPRRKSMLSMTPAIGSRRPSSAGSMVGFGGELASTGTPILVNQRCSGYFVEPLTWMEPILKTGQISGKIVCPNEKCGAKIGNFDWAGVQCGCKEWVTPGFCISRSKVDEVW